MEQLLFTRDYYYYVIFYSFCLVILQVLAYQDIKVKNLINIVTIVFAVILSFYLGNRDLDIGPDTIRYERSFLFYRDLNNFEIRKDVFFDLLSYLLSKILNFKEFLVFCATIYMLCTLYGLKLIFKKNYYIAFFIFLISPYFMANGISAIRSGMAASLFFVALGVFYKTRSFKKAIIWMILSLLIHISMILPLIFFMISRYVKNTKFIFLVWLLCICFAALNFNIVSALVSNIGLFEDRIGAYSENVGERNYWTNFAIFGFCPVLVAVYNVLVLDYKDSFFRWFLSSYMLVQMPYILLLNSEYGLRVGYLAEFMMPILLVYPFIINSTMKIRFVNLKLLIILFLVFMFKAYKLLTI